jgi:carboxyl-terminal processing protease
MSRRAKTALLLVVGLVAALLLVSGGVLAGLNPDVRGALYGVLPGSLFGSSSSEDFDLQREVLDQLESNYYKPLDPEALETGAIDGMVASLDDPYTVYMDPEEYAGYLEHVAGSYSGVGMTVEMKDNLVTIVSTFKGSPAEQAGIEPGDIILAVDGVSTEGQSLDDVVSAIKGLEDTDVTLTVYRPPASTTTTVAEASGDSGGTDTESPDEDATADVSQLPPGGESNDYTLTRKTIEVPVVDSELLDVDGKKVALISFYTFSDGSAAQLRAEVEQAIMDDNVDAIILDLRSNGGGLLNEAVSVASIFIPDGVIVSTEGLHSPKEVYYAEGDAYPNIPVVVLVDEYTASASEIVSGAMQDHERAVLVGETTFGKGLVQIITSLSNGGALKVTTAVYLTPNGRDINETGITPEVVAPDDPTTEVDEGLEAAKQVISGTTTAGP